MRKPRPRAPLTALEAKCCCACAHWQRNSEQWGDCTLPGNYWGVEYSDGTIVNWWTTGCYATCEKWEVKP